MTKNNAWRYHNSTITKQKHKRNYNQDQGDNDIVRPRVHISLGWMDARDLYVLTIILCRSYYISSTHVFRMKPISRGMECNGPRGG